MPRSAFIAYRTRSAWFNRSQWLRPNPPFPPFAWACSSPHGTASTNAVPFPLPLPPRAWVVQVAMQIASMLPVIVMTPMPGGLPLIGAALFAVFQVITTRV